MATTKGFTIAARASLALLSIVLFMSCRRKELVSFGDGQNVLVDGSFEDGTGPDGPFAPNANGVMSIRPGATTIPGWLVFGGAHQEVAWASDSNKAVPNAATDGTHFLDLTGVGDTAATNHQFGGVAQTFATTAGKPYILTFDIGVYRINFPGPIAVHASVSHKFNDPFYGEKSCPFDTAATGPQWKHCNLNFTAQNDSTTIRIFGEKGNRYIGLDKVSVECFAPLGRTGYCSS